MTAAVPGTDVVMQKKILGLSRATLVISNEDINYTMKKIKSLKEFVLLLKSVSETIKNGTIKTKKLIYQHAIRHIRC